VKIDHKFETLPTVPVTTVYDLERLRTANSVYATTRHDHHPLPTRIANRHHWTLANRLDDAAAQRMFDPDIAPYEMSLNDATLCLSALEWSLDSNVNKIPEPVKKDFVRLAEYIVNLISDPSRTDQAL